MNIELGEFVVMPNHIHGIIIIVGRDAMHFVSTADKDATHCVSCKDATHCVSCKDATHCVSCKDATHCVSTSASAFAPQSKNLSSIIRGYKSAVTTYARKNGIDFDCQPRFHDHIIRDAQSFENIQNYITNNPSNWNKDKFYE
jgi:REP element-mobilizing transposase RayT